MAIHSRYLDLAAKILDRIVAGEWRTGDKLPRLDDLAKEYDANRNTVGRAIEVLEAEGYVSAVQGRGIVVRQFDRMLLETWDDIAATIQRCVTLLDETRAAVDPVERIQAASRLAERFEALRTSMYALRNTDVITLMNKEGLSLGQLAKRVGISKARADQIVRAGRAKKIRPSG